MSTPSPHDALFKRAFSDPEVARSLLRSQLPSAIAGRVDWSALTLEPGSFVDERLSARHTDLLFSTTIGDRPALLYLLLEHQSREDPWMPLRMLEYVLRIWQAWRTEHPDGSRLPPVLPIVLHAGPRPWKGSAEIYDLVEVDPEVAPDLAPFLPRLRFVLDDVAGTSDQAIADRALEVFGEVSLRALARLPFSVAPVEEFRRWLPMLRRMLRSRSGLQRLSAILEYLRSVADAEPDAVHAVVQELGPAAEEIDVTIAERLIEKGREEGREEGRLGQATLLLRLLSLRFSEVPEAVQARVRAGSSSDIERWSERVLTASQLDEVFAEA